MQQILNRYVSAETMLLDDAVAYPLMVETSYFVLGEGFSGSDMSSVAAPNLKNRLVQPFGSAQDGFLSKFYQAIRRSFPNSAFLFFHHIWKAESPRG